MEAVREIVTCGECEFLSRGDGMWRCRMWSSVIDWDDGGPPSAFCSFASRRQEGLPSFRSVGCSECLYMQPNGRCKNPRFRYSEHSSTEADGCCSWGIRRSM